MSSFSTTLSFIIFFFLFITFAQGRNLTCDTNHPATGTFVLGESIQLICNLTNSIPNSISKMYLNVTDEYSNSIQLMNITITSDSLGNGSVAITSLVATSLGYYSVSIIMDSGETIPMLGTRPAGFVTYAIVIDPLLRVDYGNENTLFGMQGGFNTNTYDGIPYLGFRYVLEGSTSWTSAEGTYPDQFSVTRQVNGASNFPTPLSPIVYKGKVWNTYKLIIATQSSVPLWALGTSGGSIIPNFGPLNSMGAASLTQYATALAKRVVQDFPSQTQHVYQITWEPFIYKAYRGNAAQIVQMYQLVYKAIHDIDTKAIVCGPTLFYDSKMSGLWNAGMGEHMDAVCMHPYVAYPPETNQFVKVLREQMQAAKNATGLNIPFYGTEHGLVSGQIGLLNAALGNIRQTLILLGEGFKFDFNFYFADFWGTSPTETDNTYGFFFNLNPAVIFGTTKVGPKPVVPAFSALTYLLDGSTSGGDLSQMLSGTQLGYKFYRGTSVTFAIWDYGSSSTTLNVPSNWLNGKQCTWMGVCSTLTQSTVTLSRAPIYIITTA